MNLDRKSLKKIDSGRIEAMKKKTFVPSLVFLLLVILLAACNNQPAVTPIVETAETQPPVIESATVVILEPTATSTPVDLISAELVFWEGQGSLYNDQLAEGLKALAQARGNTFEQRENLNSRQITPSVRIVVTTADPNEVQEMAEQLPNLQILAVDSATLSSASNLHTILNEGGTLEQRAFLAGYSLALTTDDYRVGVISQADDDAGIRTRDSFVTGARYFCGLCNARYMPVDYYPYTAEVTDPGNQVDWQAAVDALLAKTVTAIFVQPELSSVELMTYLASKNITVVAVEGQPGLEAAGRVLGVLGTDLYGSVEQAVITILEGGELAVAANSLELKQIDPQIMSEGKHILFERIRQELLSGMIKDRP